MYKHNWLDGQAIDLPVGKVVCVGRNYAEHARELNNPIPSEPLLFMKPATAVVPFEEPIVLNTNKGSVHYEVEIAVLIGRHLKNVSAETALKNIAGIGVALDLTRRDLQSEIKAKGHPWEKSKAFDGSCPLSRFIPSQQVGNWEDIDVRLAIDGEQRQTGNSHQMLYGIGALISYISDDFTLQPGDVVITGTPAGVGQLTAGMKLTAELPELLTVNTEVKPES